MLNYHLEPFGTSRDVKGNDYDEFTLLLVEDEQQRGRFRLSAHAGEWAFPTADIVTRLYSYIHKGGAKDFIRKPQIQMADGTCYARFTVLDYDVHIGPLEDTIPRVFIYDGDGGCTGHISLADLPELKQILTDLWNIKPGPNLFVDLYLQHAAKALRNNT